MLTDTLRKALDGPSTARIIGVYDGFTAQLAERAGAEALWASGLCIASSQSLPDNEIPTYDSLLSRLVEIRRGATIPILVDGNAGFGNDVVLSHFVRLTENAGMQGVCIEDKAYPRANSFAADDRIQLMPAGQFAVKIYAAAEARRSLDFLIFARVEGLIAGMPPDQVKSRARLYAEAGADAIVVHSKASTAAEILAFGNEWGRSVPLVVIPTTYPGLSLTAAGRHGIAAVIYANQVMRVAAAAVQDFLAEATTTDSLSACTTPMTPLSDFLAMSAALDETDDDAARRLLRRYADRYREIIDPSAT